MSRRTLSNDDISTLLYVVPFAVSAIYALVTWAGEGLTYFLPSTVYLDVTRSPYVFAVGAFAVFAGVALELRGTVPEKRGAKLHALGSTLQTIAASSFVLAIICALYANGFTGVLNAGSDIIVGRYALVFPAMLVLMSYLITARFNFASLGSRAVIGIILLLLVPVSLRELGKRNIMIGLAGAFVLIILGIGVLLIPRTGAAPEKEE